MAEPALKDTNWYVLHVATGVEERILKSIKQILNAWSYESCFVPFCEKLYKKEGRYVSIKKPLFPGYLFIISDYIDEISQRLCDFAGYIRILGMSGSFVCLDKYEVEAFKCLADQNYNISVSRGFITGDQIVVTEGPLIGQEGLIKKIDRHKRTAFVEMPFLGKTTYVRVPLEIVSKIF